MERETRYLLEDFIFDLTEIQSSDVLAHVDLGKKDIFWIQENNQSLVFPLDGKLNQIIKVAAQNKRQSDTDTLCLAIDGIEWKYKGKTVTSPLWLIPTQYKFNKVRQEIEFFPDLEAAFFNPFVRNGLKRNYDLVWADAEIEEISQKSTDLFTFLAEAGLAFSPVNFNALGNFHHHRFQIVKDLEALVKIEPNHLVQEMLGNPAVSAAEKPSHGLQLTKQNIVSSDKDQQQVFEKFSTDNLVIEGPPGTGKSQVLTNLLAKLLEQGKMNLVVSGKKAALEVLEKKLSLHGLDAFTFISHNQTKPADFIEKLKKTWNLLETKISAPEKNLLLSEQLLAQLQLTIDKLSAKNLIGGIDLRTFKKRLSEINISDVTYTSDVPSVAEWLQSKELVEQLEAEISSFEVLKHFRFQGLTHVEKLDQMLLKIKSEFQILTGKLEFRTFGELESRISQLPRCQILENESYKKYLQLFSSKRARKKFEKLRFLFLQQKEAVSLIQSESRNWKEKPTLSLAQSWKIQLSGNWWKKRSAERQIRSMLAVKTILPEVALENWLQFLHAEAILQETLVKLLELGIERPELELESIAYVLGQLEKTGENELNQVSELSPQIRKSLVESGNQLQHRYRELKEILDFEPADLVLETIEAALKQLSVILPVQQKLKQIPAQLYGLLQKFHDAETIEKVIFKSNWMQFESRFPELARFDGTVLKSALEKIIDQQAEENKLFGRNLVFSQYQKFNDFHHLLRTPANKLNVEEKTLKAKLKTGKAMLVKEFGKTKQYKTIRELLDSDARLWIEVLTPVWLSTPAQVATSFPMENGLFECVIFDEASQIPLSHALGSLQRANRAVVAGDAQQMSPSSYFSGSASSVDLLHQASYHWQKSPLKHHYRSLHPELIAFSNRFFYNNELIAYPSAERFEQPVKLHFVPDAVNDGRQNLLEAKKVAEHIEKYINKTDSLGIVAFSEQQLDCVWKQLSATTQTKLTERIEERTLFFKALEQVQGDECDHLIISFGYGKNPDGEFHLRFGPLNQKNGSKRLNVLFSRARKSISFFSSVQAIDFSVSTNEAVNLLRFFLRACEENHEDEIVFPFGLIPIVKKNIIEFDSIVEMVADAEELVTLYNTLVARGWNVNL